MPGLIWTLTACLLETPAHYPRINFNLIFGYDAGGLTKDVFSRVINAPDWQKNL